MTIEILEPLINNAAWFSRLGMFTPTNGALALTSLRAWSGSVGIDASESAMADQMDWLPSSRDQADPFETVIDEDPGMAVKNVSSGTTMHIYKRVLESLHLVPANERLKAGPHDFTNAAKGAALYAFSAAAKAALQERSSPWFSICELYSQCYWPCGLMDRNVLVVF